MAPHKTVLNYKIAGVVTLGLQAYGCYEVRRLDRDNVDVIDVFSRSLFGDDMAVDVLS